MRGRWLPVALYIGLIFALSSIRRPPPGAGVWHLDKLLHLGEYAVLGGLLARALRPLRSGVAAAAGIALVIGLGVAAADELYQRTVPGRVSSAADGVADVGGVALGLLALDRWQRRRDRKRGA